MQIFIRRLSYILGSNWLGRLAGPSLAVLATLGAPGGLDAQAARVRPAVLDSLVDAEIARRQPFAGLQLAVTLGEETVYRRSSGLADLEHLTPMPAQAVFQIASITKEFTAAAILRLVEEGRISLDDDIRNYVPEVDTEGHVMTVRQLLNHTSGIPNIYALEAWPSIRPLRLDRAGTRELILAAAADEGLDFEPGTDWRYSNTGYDLLGDIIGVTSGMDVADYFREVLFEPLGLEHTSFCPWSRIIPGRAQGYEPDGDSLVNAFRQSQGVLFTSGGICSTVDDLLRWNQALHGGRVLRPASYRKMITPEGASTGYGFGIFVGEIESHAHLGHNGYINGYSSQLEYFPEDSLSITILTNTPAAVQGLAEDMARSILGLTRRAVATRPEGWKVRGIPAQADTTSLNFRTMGPGVHVTGGAAALYFHPDSTGQAPFAIEATFNQIADPDPDEGEGLVFGGRGLTLAEPEYLRFRVRGTGEYALALHRNGREELLVPWTGSPAIDEKRSVGTSTNTLNAFVSDGSVRLSVNGQVLGTFSLPEGIRGEGVVGMWLGAGSDVHVDGFGFRATPAPDGGMREAAEATCETIDPAWSSDGAWILFASDCEGNYELYRVHPDGSGMERLTRSPGMEHNPRSSPDGSLIAYSYHVEGAGGEIRLMDADGGSPRTILSNGFGNWGPRWSPDGNRLTYESTREGNGDVYVLEVDTGEEKRVTTGEARELAPDWSPDGSIIAFQTDSEGAYTIHGVDPGRPSRGTERMVKIDGHAVAPNWAQSGERLVFACVLGEESDTEICATRPDGSDLERLTDNEWEDFSPSFSPDARSVVYMRRRAEGGWEVRVLTLADGTETVLPRP